MHFGQAMTELLITASFVLVPLFLLIPLLGKYIDIKSSSIQAARYEAWEYTVWYANDSQTPDGFPGGPMPVKSPKELQSESRRRLFSKPGLELNAADKSAGWLESDRKPLWQDHAGLSLYDGGLGTITPSGTPRSRVLSSEPTPDVLAVREVTGALPLTFSAAFPYFATGLPIPLPSILRPPTDFDAAINTGGYSQSIVAVPISTPPGLVDVRTLEGEAGVDVAIDIGTLVFNTEAAVLSDGWNAGGVEHTFDRVGGIVPTNVLSEMMSGVPGLAEVLAVATYLTPELRGCDPPIPHPMDPEDDGSLWLGYIDIDAVPPDRLESGGSIVCSDGMCDFDPPRTEQSPCDF